MKILSSISLTHSCPLPKPPKISQPWLEKLSLRMPLLFMSPSVFNRPYTTSKNLSSRCRILSIDGGGIRGIIPGKILEEIERITKKPIANTFDFIGGTSTGGIIGLGLSLPSAKGRNIPKYTASEVLQFYLNKELRQKIFQKPNLSKLPTLPIQQTSSSKESFPIMGLQFESGSIAANLMGQKVIEVKGGNYEMDTGLLKIVVPKQHFHHFNTYRFDSNYEGIRRWIQPRYNSEGIEGVLKSYFGNTKFSELLPKEVLVTTFTTSTMRHKIWSKAHATVGRCRNITAWEGARATSAAPMYFPSFWINGEEYLDGGVCMNDPALALLSQAKNLGIPKKHIFCVSLGTGQFLEPLAPTSHFGAAHWAINIFEAASQGSSSQTEEYVGNFLKKDQYIRIQANLKKNIPLDACDDSTIEELERIAKKTIKENRGKLEKIIQKIEE